MLKTKPGHMAVFLILVLLISALLPLNAAGASTNDPPAAVLKLTPGLGNITVNGISIPAGKPYNSGTVLYIPLRAVMEAFGADVVLVESNRIDVLFKDISAELTIGKKEYMLNQTDASLSAPPVLSGPSVMVPSDFVTGAFGIKESADAASGEVTFTLDSDGALDDLSFLTGSLGKPRAGNSYFGWSLALPRGSVLTARTFNSKKVQFENDYRQIAIDMDVRLADGKSLKDYYKEITENPYPAIRAELIDSRLSGETAPGYIELFYADIYDEAIYHRIYAKGGYFYNLIVTSVNESNPELLLKDASIKSMLDSFSLEYKGESPDTTDLSKVSYGLARYNNYISSETTGKKLVSWEMSILPEWDLAQASGGGPYITQFGNGSREYVSIETSPADGRTAEETGKELRDGYLKNFNPALFSLKSSGMSEVAGDPAYSMLFEVKSGKTLYTYEERIVAAGGLVYDISFKTPSDAYAKKTESFGNMLNTFKPDSKDAEELSAEMEKYRFNNGKTRLGKDNSPVQSENKSYRWSITLPGAWQKNGLPGLSMETFYDKASGGMISVEAVSKKDSRNEADTEKFLSMSMVSVMGLEPAGTDSIRAKGAAVKVYRYRVDDEDTDDHADVVFYVLEGKEFSYCYMGSIPDLTASPANLAVMEAAWDSFRITD